MSLTLGTGPLGDTDGRFNFDIAAASPEHRLFVQHYGLRLRAVIADTVVLDTVRAQLLHETGLPARVLAPWEDFRIDLLHQTDSSSHCPFKGDATYWTLRTPDGRAAEDAVWAYEEPPDATSWLRGLAAPAAQQVEAWFVEDERVTGHLKDPYHRVDVYETSRPVEVVIGGETVVRTERAKLLQETSLPVRPYVPAVDVPAGLVRPGSGLRTVCPYKGEASYWTVAGITDVAWSYETPLADALRAQGHLAFDDSKDGVEVRLA